jgi:hypothetical protein
VTNKPHDALFKAAFEDPEHAGALLRHLLPSSVSAAIVWDSMTLEAGSFVDAELADRHTDLLFSVNLHDGGEALLYLLLEHQSSSDPDMPLRVLVYEVRIWERFRKEHPGRRLPPILPVVISHDLDGWTVPRSFEDLFDPNVFSIPGLAELVPRFSLVVDDLTDQSNANLRAWTLAAFPMLALWALRDGRYADRFRESCGDWVTAFVEAWRAPHGVEALTQLMRYFALVTDPLPFQAFRAKIREQIPGAEEITMTFAEQMRREGRAQERAEILRRLLVLKFGSIDAVHDTRITAATSDLLDRYLERVLTATTLGGVFAE